MQLTIDSDEPIDHVLEVVAALYGVRLEKKEADGPPEDDHGITIIRH